jgi:adenylate cyclase
VLAITAAERHALRDDGEGAAAQVERALALNPHCYLVVDLAATVHMQRDRPDRAIELFQHCLRLSPSSPSEAITLDSIAVSHLVAGRFQEAVEWGRRGRALQAGWNEDSVTLTIAYAMLGRLDEARSELERVLAVRPGFTIRELCESRPPRTSREATTSGPKACAGQAFLRGEALPSLDRA